jgi:hypothetical protein
MQPFRPSLELSRLLYEEEIKPIIDQDFPDVPYAAATMGMCSEALGLDDQVSMDHMWGPRVTLFLSKEDNARYGEELIAGFKQEFPKTLKGLKATWKKPGADIQNTSEEMMYSVWTTTVDDWLKFCGGKDALPLSPVDWLRASEQHLLEFTNGVVHHDDTGELTEARKALAYYPDDVLRWLLMCDWNSVGGDWFPIGRIGSRGDQLGLRIQIAKVAHHLMRIGFRVSRRYYTYKKWFGTLFKRLPIAERLEPVLLDMLAETDWDRADERIRDAATILLEAQNALGIGPKVTLNAKQVDDGRHHLDMDFWGVGRRTAQKIPAQLRDLQKNEVFWLHERQLILWNEEVGKWTLFLQQERG